MTDHDLRELERSTFRAAADSGLWDVFLAAVISLFAIAPYLSVYLGDFWSSAVFIPVWGLLFWGLHQVRVKVVLPRVGAVEFGKPRTRRLRTLGVITLVVNVVALVAGLVAAVRLPTEQGHAVTLGLSIAFLLQTSSKRVRSKVRSAAFMGRV